MNKLEEMIFAEHAQYLEEAIARVTKAETKEDLSRHNFTPAYQRKFDKLTLEELKDIAVKQLRRERGKSLARDIDDYHEVMNCGEEFVEATLTVEWHKSATWGNNPQCEVHVIADADGGIRYHRHNSSRIGGCGYDKESSATAQALNQSLPFKKALYEAKEKAIEKGEKLPYGLGYGILPHLEGGVGVSTYRAIAELIGCQYECISSGKTFDVYKITRVAK